MSQATSTSPVQLFSVDVGKALRYGKVFIQGNTLNSLGDATGLLQEKASQLEVDFTTMFPKLIMAVLSEKDKKDASAISKLLSSLRSEAEGTLFVACFQRLVC